MKTRIKRNTLVVFLFILGILQNETYAQFRNIYRYEVFGGLGPANFLGELGGANRVGTHMLRDFDLNSVRYDLTAGIRYRPYGHFAIRAAFTFIMLSGKDALTEEKYRHNRNLSFKSPVYEGSVQFEYYLFDQKHLARYSLKGLSRGRKRKGFSLYLFAGIGGFHFQPKARYNGSWYKLRDMHTEGEGLKDGAKEYSLYSICIPMGLGFRQMINKRWSISAELSFRKTFTDYIDDVSTNYYDKSVINQNYGQAAAYLSDPSLGDIPGATNTHYQRGNPKFKDAYTLLTFAVNYKLSVRRNTRAKF